MEKLNIKSILLILSVLGYLVFNACCHAPLSIARATKSINLKSGQPTTIPLKCDQY